VAERTLKSDLDHREGVVPPRPAHTIVADVLAAPRVPPRVLRVQLRSGEWLIAKDPFFADTEMLLHFHVSRREVRALKSADIQAIAYRRGRWGARLLLGGGVFLLGIVVGAMVDVHSGSTFHDGALLDGILSALVAPLIVWLMQDVPPFGYWHVVPVGEEAGPMPHSFPP